MSDGRSEPVEGARTLLLLHGLGAHGGVWAPFIDAIGDDWPGPVLSPDLPGHGTARWIGAYGIAEQAPVIAQPLHDAGPVTIVAHSMGALVGLALATGCFGVAVERVLAIGIKVDWTEAERQGAAEQARKPIRWFDDRDAAVERFLKVSGLDGVASGDAMIARGIAVHDGRWRLSADPATPSVGAPDMAKLMAAVACPVRLARGADDRLVTLAALQRHDPAAVDLPGGHNAHIEEPAAVARVLRAWRSGT